MNGNAASPRSFDQRYSMSPSQAAYQSQRILDQSAQIRNTEENMMANLSMPLSRTPECQKILDRISPFCGKDNLVQRVSFLDQELSVFGYPSLITDLRYDEAHQDQQSGTIDLVTMVNICYDLLRCWRQAIETQGEANDLQRSTESELVRVRHLVSRLKEDVAGKDRELKSKDLMQLQFTQRSETLKKKLKTEQDKCKRLGTELTTRDSQFRHEKKKRLQEIEKLQARLQQLLQDKRQERMLGIEILNSLQRSDGKRGKWSTDKTKKSNEQEMYRLIITNYEDAQKQLLKENEGMRRYLKEMQNELISALNERHGMNNSHDQSNPSMQTGKVDGHIEGDKLASSASSSAASNASDGSEVSEHMSDGMFEMPYDLVKEDIERSIRTKWRALKKEIKKTRIKANRNEDANKENFQPTEYDDLVQQQQDLIDYLTTGQGQSSERPVPEDSYFLEEKAELEKQKNSFKQQKQSFEKERKLYAEALLQLEEQRRGFETEKNKWLQQNFLQLTPFRGESRPSTTPHHSKEPSQRRPLRNAISSVSPDRSLFKASDPASNFHMSTHEKNSPISHTLSRLHSSSRPSTFSPEIIQHRSPDPRWQGHSPETLDRSRHPQPQQSKSTPHASGGMAPPSTAELYRTLGLVYYGSDKENEEGVNSVAVRSKCPRSSGTARSPDGYDEWSRSNSNAVKVKIRSKAPSGDRNADHRSSTPEFVSAEGSAESLYVDGRSAESEYFDTKSSKTDSPNKQNLAYHIRPRHTEYVTERKEKTTEKVRSPTYFSWTKVPKEQKTNDSERAPETGVNVTVPYISSEFQLSKSLPQSETRFSYSKPERRASHQDVKPDKKSQMQYVHQEDDRHRGRPAKGSRGKRYGIRQMMKSLIQSKGKRDSNNNLRDSRAPSHSDSYLSLRHFLDQDVEAANAINLNSPIPSCGMYPYPHSSGDSSPTPTNQLNLGHASGFVRTYRTRSLPGSETADRGRRRSHSCEIPELSAAAERHKSALMSMSARLWPAKSSSSCGGISLHSSDNAELGDMLRRRRESNLDKRSQSMIDFNQAERQSRKSTSAQGRPVLRGILRTSSSRSYDRDYAMPVPGSRSQMDLPQNGVRLHSGGFRPLSHDTDPVSTDQSATSLLDQLVMADDSYGSITLEEDGSTT